MNELVDYCDPAEAPGDLWTIPHVAGRVIGRPHAGRRALRLLDGMYRSAVAMTLAGYNVVLEDVVWEPTVAAMALQALGAVDPFVVRLVCPYELAVELERSRADRFEGGVAAYASEPELISAADVIVDTGFHDRDSVAQQVLMALRGPRHASQTNDR